MKVRNQEYLNAFGEHLKSLLDKKNMTPEAVAAIGMIETKQVYRAINAEHSTTLSTIAALAKGLGVHPKILLDFDFKFTED